MKKILKVISLSLFVVLLLSQVAYAGTSSFADKIFSDIKDKKAKDIIGKVTMKYVFGSMGALMGGNAKIDFNCKLNIAPSAYAKKIAGVNVPVGSFKSYIKGSFITVSPNIMLVNVNSNFIDVKVFKKGKKKIRIGLPTSKIYTESKNIDFIFGGKEKIKEIIPFPKKKESKKESPKKPDKKKKCETKTIISYVGLSTINNEKVHQIKFRTINKKNKKEIVTVILDVTDEKLDIRRLSLNHKLVKGSLVINSLDFGKPQNVKQLSSVFKGYKKVKEDKFKEIFYSVLLVNFFKLLK